MIAATLRAWTTVTGRELPTQGGPAEPAVVRTAIDEILGTSEFHRGETVFDTIKNWIVEFLSDLLPDGALSPATLAGLAAAVAWILLIALVVIVVTAAVKSLRANRVAETRVAVPDPEVDRARRIAELRSRAREANARGDHVLALRLEFSALVVGLGERGDLEYRDAFTNRELLERGRPGRKAEAVLRPLVPELDRKSFGGEPATRADFERLNALCDALLQGARA
ncbi:MAG: hypothetical protein NTY35_08775 [Planctomycetota bacterium]|nr:hypothetical protein [Planctomycetota bacterium]